MKLLNFTKNHIFYSSFSTFVCMSLALFSSTQSASFYCKYKNDYWDSTFGTIYYCDVQNDVNITSLDAAQVDSISGEHLDGYNNDNVEAFHISGRGKIHYFPRGLNKFFKNLTAIQIADTGLKEIHQSDLKDFTELKGLYLQANDLEILEENLFKFNLNLDYIYLNLNKITHIDPNVFVKLTKLNSLNLILNTCIDMAADEKVAEVQNIINAAQAQCTNSGYSNLEQKVRNLEVESENFKENLEKLENEVKNSKFQNFFQERLKDLKADQVKKEQDEATTITTPTTTASPISTTKTSTKAPKESESNKDETCSALESKIDMIAANLNYCVDQAVNGTNSNKIDNDHQQNEQCAAIKEDLRKQTEEMDTWMDILDGNVEDFKTSALKEIHHIKNAIKDANHGLMMLMNKRADKNEKHMKKIEEKLAKLLKALKIDDLERNVETEQAE